MAADEKNQQDDAAQAEEEQAQDAATTEAADEQAGEAPSDEASADDAPAPDASAQGESAQDDEAPAEEAAPAEAETADAEASETDADVLTLPQPPAEAEGRSFRKERVGTVESAKMNKTIVVSIQRQKKHPMYSKYLTRTSRLMVHDEDNDAGEGDTVLVMETRPLSKHKRWRLLDILERAK